MIKVIVDYILISNVKDKRDCHNMLRCSMHMVFFGMISEIAFVSSVCFILAIILYDNNRRELRPP